MAEAEFPNRLPIVEARAAIVEACRSRQLSTERLARDGALGRVLAEDVSAPHDLPPFANSAMDGYAVRAADLVGTAEKRLRLAGVILAGAPAVQGIAPCECMRITTGAPLPEGADAVVIKERARIEGEYVLVPGDTARGAHVRRAGEDYRSGETALHSGRRLRPVDIGLLATLGCGEVAVSRAPRVAVFSSGDELVASGQALGFGQIHDSNGPGLAALLRQSGIEPERVAHLVDDPASMREHLREAASACDVIVTCGGVSAGEADYMPQLIGAIGRIHFWKVRIRPGMPILFGELESTLVFALPGNPVSAIVTWLILVLPGLLALQGCTEPARRWRAHLALPIRKRHERTEYQRAHLESRDDGTLWVTPLALQGSGMLRGVVDADCLLEIPEDVNELEAGAVVEIVPLPGLC
ncbi:MAG: gephyrin-like molybdotransferase Glp [Rhodanobacteraceae bacterium]